MGSKKFLQSMKKTAASLLIVSGAAFGLSNMPAAEAYNGNLEDITLTASAQREVAPDMAYVYFSLRGQGGTSEEAAQQAAMKAAAVKRALLGSAYTGEDYQQVRYALNPVYKEKGKISGYQAVNTLKLRVSDLQKIGSVIDKLAGAGADNIDSIEFTLRNKELVQDQLLAEAVASAKRRAAAVANADGRQIGRLLTARVNTYSGMGRMYAAKNLAKSEGAAADTVIEPVKLEINANVDVTFALE